jgi:hypothetical protein
MSAIAMNTQGSCLARIRAVIQNRAGLPLVVGRFVLKAPFRAFGTVALDASVRLPEDHRGYWKVEVLSN